MQHVQFVSRIARTIGRALRLNEDLIEALALGHDAGHVAFGHAGERELNRMDARLSKLESSSINSINSNTNTTDYNFANSMYMV